MVMLRCDGGAGEKNGEVTENELRVGLLTTGYKGFLDWITAGRPSRFKQIDRDKSGTVGLSELVFCCKALLCVCTPRFSFGGCDRCFWRRILGGSQKSK